VPARTRTLLEGAVELDGVLGPERLLLLSCSGQVEVAALVEAARAALSKANGEPGRLPPLGLPCDEQTFWFRKVPR
jgi:hypothetical protein